MTDNGPSERLENTATPDPPPDDRRQRVLIVEDFNTMRRMIADILRRLNLEVFEAANGVEAIGLLDRQEVDLVFTDLVMPEMDGYELCEEIRRRPHVRHLPIVVISTHRDASYVIRALRCGADDYLTKPFDAPLARRVLERVLSNV